jgi:hypothetical protein
LFATNGTLCIKRALCQVSRPLSSGSGANRHVRAPTGTRNAATRIVGIDFARVTTLVRRQTGSPVTPSSARGRVGSRHNLSADSSTRVKAFVVGVVSILAVVAALPGVAAASECPNEQVRAESSSAALPSCRAYELVSPADAGRPVETQALAATSTSLDDGASVVLGPDLLSAEGNLVAQLSGPLDVQDGGSAVFWQSPGKPPGTGALESGGSSEPFRSLRTATGWITQSVLPSAQVNINPVGRTLLGASTDGSAALVATSTALPGSASAFVNAQQAISGGWHGVFFYRVTIDRAEGHAEPQLVTHGEELLPDNAHLPNHFGANVITPFAALSASPDLSEIAFKSLIPLEPEDSCQPTESELSRIAPVRLGTTYLWNTYSSNGFAHQMILNINCPAGSPNVESVPSLLTEKGPVIVPGPGFLGSAPGPLLQRLDTLALQGAQTPLAGTSAPGGTLLSVTPDESTAYVQSQGLLASGASGASNIFAMTTAQGTAGLVTCVSCSTEAGGPDQSDVHYIGTGQRGVDVLFTTDQGLWEWSASSGAQLLTSATDIEPSHVVISENGRYVVIDTYEALSNADTNGSEDLYELSADRSPVLITPGTSADSYALAGAYSSTSYTSQGEIHPVLQPIAGGVSNTGRRVVFNRTPVAGGAQVIDEWVGGQTTQISPQSAPTAYQVAAVAGAELEDVFFLAQQALVPWDTNAGVADVYDARVDGGFRPCTPGDPDPPFGSRSCAVPTSTPDPIASPDAAYPTNLAIPAASLAELLPDTSTAAVRAHPKPLTRAQKLAKALKLCNADRSKPKRTKCQKAAHQRDGAVPGKDRRRGR